MCQACDALERCLEILLFTSCSIFFDENVEMDSKPQERFKSFDQFMPRVILDRTVPVYLTVELYSTQSTVLPPDHILSSTHLLTV